MSPNTLDVSETERVIHPVYLPIPASVLRKHFAPVGGRDAEDVERHITYYLESAARYEKFKQAHPECVGLALSELRFPCQIEKDERFWVAACWLSLFYHSNREPLVNILRGCFGDTPPFGTLPHWEDCLNGKLHLYFEAQLPSPEGYHSTLRRSIRERNLIPYVLDAAARAGNRGFEGATHADAVLLNIVEAKVVSDISYQISFDVLRNQLARTVDVMLEPNPRLAHPLNKRNPELTLMLLQTPELFRQHPHSRLYGWLMNAYRTDPTSTLARDLPHREATNWESVSKRLGWITWEECNRILPGCCKWLDDSTR